MNAVHSLYPPPVVDKCVNLFCDRHKGLQSDSPRLATARFLMMHGFVRPQDEKGVTAGKFAVLSPYTAHFYYAVDLTTETCTCAHYLRHQRPCSHIFAVMLTLLANEHGIGHPAKAGAR